MQQGRADPLRRAQALLEPAVQRALERCPWSEFTTRRFIQYLLEEVDARASYEEAIALWAGPSPLFGHRTVHGLVIPRLLRASGQLQWAGYLHDPAEEDGLGVPARWRKQASVPFAHPQ